VHQVGYYQEFVTRCTGKKLKKKSKEAASRFSSVKISR